MASNRVARGRRTQALVTEWFREHGWAGAENTPASLPGKDVTGMPGWAPEVKATTRDGSLTGALKQAERNTGENEVPFVVWRPDGYGEERIGEWVVALRLSDFTDLMRQIEDWADEPEDAPGLRAMVEEARTAGIRWGPERPYEPGGADRFDLLAGRVRALEILVLGDARAEVS